MHILSYTMNGKLPRLRDHSKSYTCEKSVHEELLISRKTPPNIEYLKENWLIRARPYILLWSARA